MTEPWGEWPEKEGPRECLYCGKTNSMWVCEECMATIIRDEEGQ